MKKKYLLWGIALLFAGVIIGVTSTYWKNSHAKLGISGNLKQFTVQELQQFNGDDDKKPIYLGMNGYIYDVSAGRQFYDKNGVYHNLAGKDSSQLLNLMGGDIIKQKYPIVGILKTSN